METMTDKERHEALKACRNRCEHTYKFNSEDRRCDEIHLQKARRYKGKVILLPNIVKKGESKMLCWRHSNELDRRKARKKVFRAKKNGPEANWVI